MKIRPVTYIHIAAYLFSALVLALAAVSYYRGIQLEWRAGEKLVGIAFSQGRLLLLEFRLGEISESLSLHKIAPISLRDSLKVNESFFESPPSCHETAHFFGMTFSAVQGKMWVYMYPDRLCLIPCTNLLIPPLTWMCGFHLVRLRRRWRTERNIQPMAAVEQANNH